VSIEEKPWRVEWRRRGALGEAMRALRSDHSVELYVQGRSARILRHHLPKMLDPNMKLGWRDFFAVVRTLPFYTAFFYAEAGGRTAKLRNEREGLLVEFQHEQAGKSVPE
jgi:hypothetical protein